MGLYLSKRLSCRAYFWGGLFSEGLIIGRNFAFQNGLGLTITEKPKTLRKQLKQPKTASTNSPWAYIREGLLSEGYLLLRFGEGGAISNSSPFGPPRHLLSVGDASLK